jgi:tetratricopeptide (TPR) repeat protein
MKTWLIKAIFGLLAFLVLQTSGCSRLPKMTILDDPLEKHEHLTLGKAYEKEGNTELALKEYRLAQPLDGAYLALGNLYFVKSEKDPPSRKLAEQYYRKALNSAPSPEAANNLAWLYYLDHKLLKVAEQLAQRAVNEGIKAKMSEENINSFRHTLKTIQQARENNQAKK